MDEMIINRIPYLIILNHGIEPISQLRINKGKGISKEINDVKIVSEKEI